MAVLAGGYTLSLVHSTTPSSANFPGQEIAKTITNEWHEHYHTPLAYVAGSRWVGGNIGFYSTDHPAVFIEWNKQRAPWIKLDDLRKKGAVFVWSITDNETMPREVPAQFPLLSQPMVREFSWVRNKHGLAPIRIGIAILPPQPVTPG
jgi:hypothetical protein